MDVLMIVPLLYAIIAMLVVYGITKSFMIVLIIPAQPTQSHLTNDPVLQEEAPTHSVTVRISPDHAFCVIVSAR